MRVLVVRMSSMGDIILATSFLENLPASAEVDWVIGSEFKFVLSGHPKIKNLIAFDKKTGFQGWMKLVKELSMVSYDVRVDLHQTLRSKVAFAFFRFKDLRRGQWIPASRVSKERFRTWAYFIFKALLPKVFRPTPYWKRFAKLGAKLHSPISQNLLPPNFSKALAKRNGSEDQVLTRYGVTSKKYIAVMPASRWRSKEWDPDGYFQVLKSIVSSGLVPLLVGRKTDVACQSLLLKLESEGISFKSALEEPEFETTAVLLKHAAFYLGSDTGLFHLAESLGTKSYVIFGPTRADVGFGPWRRESQSIINPVICSPCSKDGRVCYRVFDRYACLRKLSVDQVKQVIS